MFKLQCFFLTDLFLLSFRQWPFTWRSHSVTSLYLRSYSLHIPFSLPLAVYQSPHTAHALKSVIALHILPFFLAFVFFPCFFYVVICTLCIDLLQMLCNVFFLFVLFFFVCSLKIKSRNTFLCLRILNFSFSTFVLTFSTPLIVVFSTFFLACVPF